MGAYNIEQCSAYKIKHRANGCPVYIFDSHNYSFPAWGTVSHGNGKSYRLVSFDRHADTHRPFSAAILTEDNLEEWIGNLRLQRNEFLFEDAFRACNCLRNDEQIKAAYDFGYIDGYTIICHLSKRDCAEYADYDAQEGYSNVSYCSWNMAKDFLIAHGERLLDNPILLDFDLDFFPSLSNLSDEFFELVNPFICAAEGITIAKEPFHFDSNKVENVSLDEALEKLLFHLL